MRQKYHKYLVLIYIILPCIILALPYTPEMNLYINIEGYYFSIIYLPYIISSVIILLNMNINNWIDINILLLLLSIFISSFFSENYSVFRFLISIQFLYPYFILKYANIEKTDLNNIKIIIKIIYFIIFIQVISFSTGIIESHTQVLYKFGNFIRSGTTAGGSTLTGHILVALASIIYILEESNKKKIFIIVINLIIVSLTFTRGAIISSLILLLISILEIKSKKLKIFSIIIIMLLGIIINNTLHITEALNARSLQIDIDANDISSGRIERIYNSIMLMKNNLIYLFWGFGGGNTPYFKELNPQINSILSPHNVFISIFIEHGIISLSIYIIIIIKIFFKITKKYEKAIYLICFIIISFNTEIIYRTFEISFYFWLYIFVVTTKQKNKKEFLYKTNDSTMEKPKII